MLQAGISIEPERCCTIKNPMIKKQYTPIIALLLGACTATTSAPQPSPQPVRTPAVYCAPVKENPKLGEIVSYYSRISVLTLPDATNEYNAVSRNFSKNPNNIERIKLAMLLSLPNTAFHNTAAAFDLLETWPDQPADSSSDLRDLARLFGALLVQQRQAEETVSDLGKSLANEKMHSKSLQGKIDAIKAFEINQTHRDQP